MSATQYSTPIIDRDIFFGNPKISSAQLSPDGKFITFIKPFNGVMNIWIKEKSMAFEDAIPLTDDTKRPIRSYFWSRDSKHVLYVQDKGGDENFRVYAIDPNAAKKDYIPPTVDLTPFEDIAAFIVRLPKSDESKIIVGINDRDKAWHDIYSIDISTGERTLLYKNIDQLNSVLLDLNDTLKLGSRSLPDGGNEILLKRGDQFEKILESNLEETLNPIKFDKEGRVYFISNKGEVDLSGLYLYDLDKSSMELIEDDPLKEVDIQNASFNNLTEELLATIYVGDKRRIYWKDLSFEDSYEYLKSQFEGSEISITSMTKDQSEWLFYVNNDVDPGSAYSFNRQNKNIEFLYSPRPELPQEHLCHMTPIRYNSLDGLSIPGYLTLPKVNQQKNLPAVVFVHGGPWARDYWGYNSFAQFLANRGYVVLQPNFRGSTGYGKAFLNAAINEWGEKMQDDITAAARYLVKEGYVAKDKIAIMGGSYGGYATLAGLTFTPEEYAAGVSIVGPSNLFTLLETIPPYWESARAMFHKRMGDPNTEEGRAQLKRQSPFFHAKNIKAPLLVAQGQNDPRVKKSESDQIVIAMRDLGLPVEYINFPDEGHGFARPKNNMAFITVMEKFLAKHIGGRYQESVKDEIKSIVETVTVDISGLEMPKIISSDERNKVMPLPSYTINEEKLKYNFTLLMGEKEMSFELKRSISIDENLVEITDSSESPMGNMSDYVMLRKTDFSPLKRNLQQNPLSIELEIKDNDISGHMNMGANVQNIEESLNTDFILDGASLDLYLTSLEKDLDASHVLRVFDIQSQKLKHFQFKPEAIEKIDLYECYRCSIFSVEENELVHEYWILKSDSPVLVRKRSILKEMNGAEMIITLTN